MIVVQHKAHENVLLAYETVNYSNVKTMLIYTVGCYMLTVANAGANIVVRMTDS